MYHVSPKVMDGTVRILNVKYDGFSTAGYDHHKGYLSFSKALRLFNTD